MEQTATSPKPNRLYFLKEIVSNEVLIKGKKPAFENIGSNRGVIALDPAKESDQEFIAGLTDFANRGVGGVLKLSAEQYAQKKSQPISNPSGRHNGFDLRIRRPVAPAAKHQPPPAAADPTAEGAAPPADPLKAMGLGDEPAAPATPEAPAAGDSEAFRPPTRRISRNKPKPGKGEEPAA